VSQEASGRRLVLGITMTTVVFIILVLGLYARSTLLVSHFTHIDDVGVPNTILIARADYCEVDIDCVQGKLVSKLEYISRKVHSKEYISSSLGDLNQSELFLSGIYTILKKAYWFHRYLSPVPSSWTYAPNQFYITDFFLSGTLSYDKIKLMSRLPSLLLNLATMVLIVLLVKKLTGTLFNVITISVLTLLALSWSMIIYSSQAQSYSAGPFALVCTVLLFLGQFTNNSKNFISLVGSGVAFGILCGFQYQIYWMAPGFFLGLLIFNYGRKFSSVFRDTLFCFLGFFIVSIPNFYFLYSHVKSNSGINYLSRGDNNEYAFNIEALYSVKLLVDEFVKIILNIPVVIESVLSPFPDGTLMTGSFGILLLALCIVGLHSVIRTSHQNLKLFLFLTLSIGFTWLMLYILGKTAFSPTRHSLVLAPIIALYVGFGISYLTREIDAARLKWGGVIVLMMYVGLFLRDLPTELYDRQDKVSTAYVQQTLNMHKPDFVLFDYSYPVSFSTPSLTRDYAFTFSFRSEDDIEFFPVQNSILVNKLPAHGKIIVMDRRSYSLKELQSLVDAIPGLNFKYKVITSVSSIIPSTRNVEWKRSIGNGNNSLAIHVLTFQNRLDAPM
jgi:hypothetical protein